MSSTGRLRRGRAAIQMAEVIQVPAAATRALAGHRLSLVATIPQLQPAALAEQRELAALAEQRELAAAAEQRELAAGMLRSAAIATCRRVARWERRTEVPTPARFSWIGARLDPTAAAALCAGGSSDGTMTWLYPYERTLFPRGILPPVLQWAPRGGASVEAALVRLRFRPVPALEP